MKLALLLAGALALWLWSRRDDPRKGHAAALLGVPRDADAATVRAAHRRLIAALHPDTGGSADVAARINAARDILLG